MSSMCFNMPHSTLYGFEDYYQPPPQVNDNISMDELIAQMSALTTQVSTLTSSNCFNANQVLCCENCSGPHLTLECMYEKPSPSFDEEQQPSQMEEFMMTYMQKTETYLQNQ